jgi:hypothetical protein
LKIWRLRPCANGPRPLAPQTLCGSNTLLVWLRRVHVFERGLQMA